MLVIDDNSLDAMNIDQREQIGWGIIFFAIMILLFNFGMQVVPIAKAWGEAIKKIIKWRNRRARIKKGEDVGEEESDNESKKEGERCEHHSESDKDKGDGREGGSMDGSNEWGQARQGRNPSSGSESPLPNQRDAKLDVFCCNDNPHQVRSPEQGGLNASHNRGYLNNTNLGLANKSGHLQEYPVGCDPYDDGDIEQPMGAVNILVGSSMNQSEIRYQDPMLQQMQHNNLSRVGDYSNKYEGSQYEGDSILEKSHKDKYYSHKDSRDNKVIEMKRITNGHSREDSGLVNPHSRSKRSHATQPPGGQRRESGVSHMTQQVGGQRREYEGHMESYYPSLAKSYCPTPLRNQANSPRIYDKELSPGRDSDLSMVSKPFKLPSGQRIDTGRGTSNSDPDNPNANRTSDDSNVDEMRQNYDNFTK
jgi:hypothetical protein